MSRIQPDLQHQLSILTKFHAHIFNVFKKLKREMKLLGKCIVHGDSKIDNFLYKKNIWTTEDEYQAMMIDWQGSCYDFVSGDLMWALYGFMKNLPDKNSTVDTFLDYSLAFYHKEIHKLFNLLRLDQDDDDNDDNDDAINKARNPKFLPKDDYDAVQLIHKGFIYEFLKTALIKPVLQLQRKDELLEWFNSPNRNEIKPPDEATMFKTGSHFSNFVHLYFTIATEIGVFHDLGSHCIAAMRAAIFGGDESDGNQDSEWEENEDIKSSTIVTTKEEEEEEEEEEGESKSVESSSSSSSSKEETRNDDSKTSQENENRETKGVEKEMSENKVNEETKEECNDHDGSASAAAAESKDDNNNKDIIKLNNDDEFIEEETVNFTLKL